MKQDLFHSSPLFLASGFLFLFRLLLFLGLFIAIARCPCDGD